MVEPSLCVGSTHCEMNELPTKTGPIEDPDGADGRAFHDSELQGAVAGKVRWTRMTVTLPLPKSTSCNVKPAARARLPIRLSSCFWISRPRELLVCHTESFLRCGSSEVEPAVLTDQTGRMALHSRVAVDAVGCPRGDRDVATSERRTNSPAHGSRRS